MLRQAICGVCIFSKIFDMLLQVILNKKCLSDNELTALSEKVLLEYFTAESRNHAAKKSIQAIVQKEHTYIVRSLKNTFGSHLLKKDCQLIEKELKKLWKHILTANQQSDHDETISQSASDFIPQKSLLRKAMDFLALNIEGDENGSTAIFIGNYQNYIPQSFLQAVCPQMPNEDSKQPFMKNTLLNSKKQNSVAITESADGLFEIGAYTPCPQRDTNFEILVNQVLHRNKNTGSI